MRNNIFSELAQRVLKINMLTVTHKDLQDLDFLF